MSPGQSESARGWRFWARGILWGVTHPFGDPDNNPCVKATLADFQAEVERITARRIADDLREEFPPSDIPDYIDREFGGVR